MNLLVTGGAGFIGSHFVRHWVKSHPQDRVVTLDLLSYAGCLENLREVSGAPGHCFVEGDIRHRQLVQELLAAYRIDRVVNFAAESHVDRSIAGAEVFVSTNVMGVQVLLEAVTAAWSTSSKAGERHWREGVCFLQISTDEVYGSLEEGEPFQEGDPLLPNNPYAASKAAADLLVRAYGKTYGLPTLITRSCNNYGPNQHGEKLIPAMVLNALEGRRLPVYGDGLQVREWLHVSDHCRAIEKVLMQGKRGDLQYRQRRVRDQSGGGQKHPEASVGLRDTH